MRLLRLVLWSALALLLGGLADDREDAAEETGSAEDLFEARFLQHTMATMAGDRANDGTPYETYRAAVEPTVNRLLDISSEAYAASDAAERTEEEGASLPESPPMVGAESTAMEELEEIPSLPEAVSTEQPVPAPPAPSPPSADESFWAMFRAQVRSDLAPLLALVPAPLQRHAATTAEQLATRLRLMLAGAFGGFLNSAETALRRIGQVANYAADAIRTKRGRLASKDSPPISPRGGESYASYRRNEVDDDVEIIYL